MSDVTCVLGTKGAPGATTLAIALAYIAPGDERMVLVDADPDGGELAGRFGLPASPGLVSLAAGARHGVDDGLLGGQLQACSPRFDLLAAPAHAEQVASALHSLGSRIGDLASNRSVVADCGRWRPDNPALRFVDAATATVLVIAPTVAGVAGARDAYSDLADRCRRVVVVARNGHPYPPDEVAAALGIDHVAMMRSDRAGVALLSNVTSGRWPRRSMLARDAATIHHLISAPTVEAVAV